MAERAGIAQVLQHIIGACKNAKLYPGNHPAVRAELEALATALHLFVRKDAEVALHIAGGELFLGDTPLSRETLEFQQLVTELHGHHIHTLVFQRGVTADELYELVQMLNEPDQFWHDRAGNLGAEMARRGVVHVQVRAGTLLGEAEGYLGDVYRPTERQTAVTEQYRCAIDTLWRVGRDILDTRTLNVKSVRATVGALLRDLVHEKDLCARLATIKTFDDYTFNHSVNVSLISMLIGSRLGLSPENLETLGTAAMLHDFGKLTIDPDILNKQHALTEEEWTEIRAHPVRGAQLILEQGSAEDVTITVAFEHHAGYDGHGYPSLPRGQTQHLFSRIVAIADVYDALSSPRIYRRQLAPDQALRYVIDGDGTHFDPLLVRVFFSVTGLYPVGTAVEFNTGEIGVVHGTNESAPLRPIVQLVRDTSGAQTAPQLVNLIDVPEDQLWVEKTLPPGYLRQTAFVTGA